MIDKLSFDVDFLGLEHGSPAERASFGNLEIRAGDVVFTEVVDLLAQTTRSSIRVSMNALGRWLAEHWWRLRFEPAPRMEPSAEWRMAHDLPAAGGGFVWPFLRFASDGQAVQIDSRPTLEAHSIRYYRRESVRCAAAAFENGVDQLIEMLLARQHDLGAVDANLMATWHEVRQERADPEFSAFRRREALMGMNPGEVDPDRLGAWLERNLWVGEHALDELVAGVTEPEASARLDQLTQIRGEIGACLSIEQVRRAATGWDRGSRGLEPWEQGEALARHLRAALGLGSGPLSDRLLSDLVHADIQSSDWHEPVSAFGAGIRDGERLSPILRRVRHPETRRFAVARLLADAAGAGAEDDVLPLTDASTARQRFQRSAAQELLCPLDGLLEYVGERWSDDEALSDAADYYGVSERLVITKLVNKRILPRDYLDSLTG